jgi:hypothetical protein
VLDLRGGEAVDVDVERLHVPEHVLVPVQFEVRVVPALEEDLHAAERLGLADLLPHGLLRERVFLGMAGRAVEGAELAVGDAGVGVVDVAVDDVGGDGLGVEPAADRVGALAELGEAPLLEQEERVGVRQAAAALGLLDDVTNSRRHTFRRASGRPARPGRGRT